MALSLVHADVSVTFLVFCGPGRPSQLRTPIYFVVLFIHFVFLFLFALLCFLICLLVLPVLVTKLAAPKAWSKSQFNIFQLSYDLIKTRA